MPRAKNMLPTPSSSAELRGQDHSSKLSSLQMTFELPPSAIINKHHSHPRPQPSVPSTANASSSSPPNLQANQTVKVRRRPSTSNSEKGKFTLPPPPTRSRKIIQMKPHAHPDPLPQENEEATQPSPQAKTPKTNTTKPTKKPKSASTTSAAAGKKMARKTAHSLIERRRRSKMNEEFAVLKGLIPACTGEMHKLAILQASIEYIHYLEDCIGKLQTQASATPATEFRFAQRELSEDEEDDEARDWNHNQAEDSEMGEPEDVEMTDSSETTTFTPSNPSIQTPVSPAQHPHLHLQPRPYPHQTHHHPSPQSYPYPHVTSRQASDPLTCPALRSQLEVDHAASASAALLLLGSERRVTTGPNSVSARGLSVRDLLSH